MAVDSNELVFGYLNQTMWLTCGVTICDQAMPFAVKLKSKSTVTVKHKCTQFNSEGVIARFQIIDSTCFYVNGSSPILVQSRLNMIMQWHFLLWGYSETQTPYCHRLDFTLKQWFLYFILGPQNTIEVREIIL